ncbi:MAG: NUDIX domain-containing protein [archaeon]
MKEEISAGIVVYLNSKGERKYLILHYEEGHFDLPKGHLEGKETPQEAAIRETKEETGLNIKIIPGFEESITYYFTDRTKNKIHKKVIFFVGKAERDKVKLSHEHVGYEWLSRDKAMEIVTYDTARDVLKKVDSFLKYTN